MPRSFLALGCVMVALCLVGLLYPGGKASAQQPTAAEPPPPPPPPPPSAAGPPPPVAPPGHQYVLVPVETYKPAPPPPPRRKRRSPGMMIAGIVTFAVSYVPPAIIGTAVAGLDPDVCDCLDGYRMLIPVVGPLTLLHDEREYNALNSLLIFDAIAQSAGVVLTVFGIIRLSANRDPELAKLDEPALDFVALPTPDGARTALQLRF